MGKYIYKSGKKAQSVKSLSCKHGDPSSTPWTYVKKHSRVSIHVIPVLRRWRQVNPWASLIDQSCLLDEF